MIEKDKVVEETIKLITENEILLEMSALYKKKTNLPINIWVDDIGAGRNNKHNLPRIKVQNDYGDRTTEDNFSVSISKTPEILVGDCKLKQKDLNKIFDWIKENYDLLIKHWNQEIDTDELKELLYK
jgi:hypothetical protein